MPYAYVSLCPEKEFVWVSGDPTRLPNEKHLNMMISMGKRVASQGNELKSSVVPCVSLFHILRPETSYRLHHGTHNTLTFPQMAVHLNCIN
jgi:hypothetical protein